MFKLIAVSLFLQLVLQTECLFSGDSCEFDDQTGSCVHLQECQPLVNEIKRAGNPMPMHMAKKLQKLTCGYHHHDPMVCCSSLVPTDTQKPDLSTHFSGISNPDRDGKPVQTDDSINSVGPADDVEAFTRATLENKIGGPITVENHPNLSLLPLNCGNIESDRIWGGNRTRLYEMPWMVLLSYDSARGPKLSCGGTLISERYVLTAAHCVAFLGSSLRLNGVILGEYDVRQDPDCEMSDGKEYCAPKVKNVTIDSVVANPGYTPQSLIDDVALVRLSQPADFGLNSMKPVCLPITRELQTESLVGNNSVVAGWGVTEDGLQSPVLLSVDLPVISRKDCQAAYNGSPRIRDTQLCAGGVKDKDSCGGDSGGPLMYPGKLGTHGVRYIQRGIVSYGSKRCGIGGFPGVYTNVAYYMDWILDNMRS